MRALPACGGSRGDSNPLNVNLRKGQVIELEIQSLAFGGAGIGQYEGLKVFVEGVIPGDKVQAAFTRIKKNFAEARLEKVVGFSKDRVSPKCKYSGICGGCSFQFMEYSKQLGVKRQHTIDALQRIGGFKNPPVSEIIPCDDIFYYRNKMEFSFGYDSKMNFALGMHVPGRRFDIMNLEECFLESPFSALIVNETRDFMREKGWEPFRYSDGSGFLKALYVREGKRTNEVMINLVTSDDVPEGFEKGLVEYCKLLLALKDPGESGATGKSEESSRMQYALRCAACVPKKIVSIYWSRVIAQRGKPKVTEESLVFGRKTLNEKMILGNGDELEFDILPQAFFQVNTYQAERLYGEVVRLAESCDTRAIFDLFCGTGTIGLFLAKHAEEVLGIELNEDAVKAARENARKNNIFNIDFFVGDVAKVLQNVRVRPSLIVVDPPRAGLTEKMIKQINDFGARELIYVSCNPASLARDCQILKQYGFKLETVQPVDMFPHSYHIENVCMLRR